MATKISGQHKSVDIDRVGLLEIDRTVFNWFNNKRSQSTCSVRGLGKMGSNARKHRG